MATFQEIYDKESKYKNTLVLYVFDVVRLVDIIDDEDDYYYVLEIDDEEGNNSYIHASVLLPVMFLKQDLPEESYSRLLDLWNLNHENKAE